MTDYVHIPVLLEEVIHWLDPQPGQIFIDATVGQGGHAEAILSHIAPTGRLLGFDRDPDNLAIAKKRLSPYGDRVALVHDSYANLLTQAKNHGFEQVDGILFDVGFSSLHIEDPTRGFSFQHEGPLDMRYDVSQPLTAADILKDSSEEELADLFLLYAEESNAQRLAKAIVDRRQSKLFLTTTDLAEFMEEFAGGRGKRHPATTIFQALRIAVNDELWALRQGLPQAASLLKTGGRLAIISFHSLEDRLVKHFMKGPGTCRFDLLTKSIITASLAEQKINPRARSAKLRVAQKC